MTTSQACAELPFCASLIFYTFSA